MARGLPTGGQGSKVYVLCAEPKEYKHLRIGYPAGRIGDRGDREIAYVPNVYVPFPAPKKRPEKIHPKIPREIHLGLCQGKFSLDFCRIYNVQMDTAVLGDRPLKVKMKQLKRKC